MNQILVPDITGRVVEEWDYGPQVSGGILVDEELAPTESRWRIRDLAGLGDWFSDLFGKSQAWYSNVNRIQNQLAVLQAEVNAIGSGIWDTIMGTIAGLIAKGQASGTPPHFYGFDWTVEDISAQAKAILVTKGHTPTDQEIATADSRARMYREMVDYAKRMAPEVRAQVEADAARVRASVEAAPLRSPAEVGEKVFLETLDERAKAFSLGGLGFGILALVALGLFALSRR